MAERRKHAGPSKANRKSRRREPPASDLTTSEQLPSRAASVAAEGAPAPHGPPVAGIGASAGGLDAFKKLFTAMPADSGIAFVLIPHLDPAHESLMVELISRHTTMPVAEAANDMPVEVNHVYIIPPNKYMTISDGALRLSGPVERGGPQTSIDLFLRSLADEKQEKAVCIILSGTGAHGTLGLKAVKAAGGMAIVQDPDTADYPAMPRNAIDTGLADFVLPVEQMPQALVSYIRHEYINGGPASKQAADELNQVLALVRARTKLDFRHYRKKMLVRRVERRMSLGQFSGIPDYLTHLREHPEEVQHLSRDLLIGVTSFFRDPDAWRVLETQVIGPLVRAREPDSPLRVWCPGCATGEEAYSLGMVLLEQLAAAQKSCPVQIFATDADEQSLDIARQAVYPESISADVPPERLSRFFTRVSDSTYQVSKQLRETVIFARQNLMGDAPFSKLDLIVCRNLLIYLEQDAQKKVIGLLHFALNEGGYLFLGPSETIGRSVDLFEPLSAKWRIYRRIGPSRPNNLLLPPMHLEAHVPKPPAAGPPRTQLRLAEMAQDYLLRRFALACVVVNRNYEVLHFAGPTDDYLIQPPGPPTHDLLSMARPGLEAKLRFVVQRAIRENAPQSIDNVMMRRGKSSRRVTLEAEPLNISKQTEGLLLVAFHERPAPANERRGEAKSRAQIADADMLRQLEQELETTREDLQSTIEELESSNEELKASNEEIMSMNEELQSANEELETSKEELQSLNEELSTVNNQLHDKVQDLESTNNDMANLLNCTDIATVFLDTGFRIRRFTPLATGFFKLIATDAGRPIADIVKQFADDELLGDAQHVLRDLGPRETEVRTDAGRWYVRRIIPYRTLDNRIDGVVLTFVDITERKLAADAVVRRLAAIVESSADAIVSKDLDGTVRTWNQGAERLYGYTAHEMVGRSIRSTVPDDRTEEWVQIMSRLGSGEHIEQMETERVRKDGSRIPVVVTYSPIRTADGKVVSVSAIARDISDRKAGEQALRDRQDRLQAILDMAADAIITIDYRGIIQSVNAGAERMFGYKAAEMVGQSVNMVMPPPYCEAHDDYIARYLQTRKKHIIGTSREIEARRKDGTLFPTELSVNEIENLKLFVGIHRDLTRRKQLERDVVEVASQQQQQIGRDLHDSVAQELAALHLLVRDLSETLRTDPAKASQLAERIERGLERSQQDLRAVLRGLIPVAVDGEGLMSALSDLADRTRQDGKVACVFDCPQPVAVADNLVATHLFLIAQEAVHNAVKHAQARKLHIRLRDEDGLALSVQDDGLGMPSLSAEHEGLGLRIMRNRTAIIGANLTIEPAKPAGTVVTCVLARKHHEPEVGKKARPRPDRR